MGKSDDKKLETGEVFRGNAAELSDSNWLSADMLPDDKDTIVQIECVIRRREVKFKDETKKGYGSLRFVGKARELGLNATHRRVLTALFGRMASGWEGQWIALYVDPNVTSFGRIVPAVRIRAKKMAPPAKGQKPEPEPSAPLTAEEMAEADRQHEERGA